MQRMIKKKNDNNDVIYSQKLPMKIKVKFEKKLTLHPEETPE